MLQTTLLTVLLVTTAAQAQPQVCNEVLAPPPRSGVDFTLGPLLTSHARGARAEVGVVGVRGWAIGVAAGFATAPWRYGDETSGAAVTFEDVSATVIVAKTFAHRGWRLRIHGGVGALITRFEGIAWPMLAFETNFVEGDDTTLLVEAGATLGYDLTPDWSLLGGPIYLRERQRFTVVNGFGEMSELTRAYEVGGWLAIQKHL